MTIAHEFAHALDCALGGAVYLSGVDPRIRRTFASATAFVTPYAASACDEYFAVM
jgi:Mlc titration factor MtfA (ptsG expression regulator)